jgi:hypothetical protein
LSEGDNAQSAAIEACLLAGQLALAGKLLAISPDTLKFTRQRAALVVRLRARGRITRSQFARQLAPHLARLAELVPDGDAQLFALRLQSGELVPAELPTSELRYLAAYEVLRSGDLGRGFDLYRDRFHEGTTSMQRVMSSSDVDVMHACPRWQGESLAGKSVHLVLEQGVGDRIMLARYFHHLKSASEVLCEHQALGALFARSFPFIQWVPPGTRPLHDGVAVPAFDLPHWFPKTSASPYLESDTIDLGQGFHVGLCWRGNPDFFEARLRDIPLARLAPLFTVPGVTWHSLCPGFRNSRSGQNMRPIVRHALSRWDDTARLVRSLDLVITVDTAVAHLAGALGRPVWLLNREHGCWRWGASGDASHWYPSMRLFRQVTDWDDVVARVKVGLKAGLQAGLDQWMEE